MTSEHKLLDLGMFPEEYAYSAVYKNDEFTNNDPTSLLSIYFETELSSIQNSRAVFSFWDLLGDVGGLNDMLTLMGGWIVSLIQIFTGSGLNRYIFKNLFMFETKKKKDKTDSNGTDQINNQTRKRRSATFPWCFWLQNRGDDKMRALYEKADRRVYRELDIVRFIQQQMSEDIQRRLLFTRYDRFILRQ